MVSSFLSPGQNIGPQYNSSHFGKLGRGVVDSRASANCVSWCCSVQQHRRRSKHHSRDNLVDDGHHVDIIGVSPAQMMDVMTVLVGCRGRGRLCLPVYAFLHPSSLLGGLYTVIGLLLLLLKYYYRILLLQNHRCRYILILN